MSTKLRARPPLPLASLTLSYDPRCGEVRLKERGEIISNALAWEVGVGVFNLTEIVPLP